MKVLTIIVFAVLLLVNLLAGVIIKEYLTENIIMSSCILLLNAILLWLVANSKMRDAFKVSYHILFPFICIIEIILAIIAPNKWEDNFFVIGIVCCVAFQFILLFAAIKTTQHNTQYD